MSALTTWHGMAWHGMAWHASTPKLPPLLERIKAHPYYTNNLKSSF